MCVLVSLDGGRREEQDASCEPGFVPLSSIVEHGRMIVFFLNAIPMPQTKGSKLNVVN